MADNLQHTLQRLRNKADLLIERHNLLRQEKNVADARIEELNSIIEQQKKEIEQLRQEVEYLKIATTIVPDRKDVERSRAILSGLVREIDKCILDLSE